MSDNNNLFFSNDPSKEPEQPQQPPAAPEPFNLGGGAQVYGAPEVEAPQPVPPYGQPPAAPPKRNNRTIIIIAVVAVVLLCCCCLAVTGTWLWNNGDAIMEELELYSALPAYLSLLG